tara:strand:+ start:181 stop:594 length:414 start_codon:yes stop_codon:yes gene_type:complete
MNNIEEILNIIHKYKFYEKEIKSDLMAFVCLGVGKYKNNNPESKLIYNNKDIIGFYIKSYGAETGNTILNYFFILPEFRRLGIFTEYINRLKLDVKKNIVFYSDKINMIRACDKLGFKCKGKCTHTNELIFEWKNNN